MIAPYAYDHVDLKLVGKPAAAPSEKHVFGTDDIGHDMFSQTLYGLRTSIGVANETNETPMRIGDREQ